MVVVTVAAGMVVVVVVVVMGMVSGRPLSMSPDLLRHGSGFLICACAKVADRLRRGYNNNNNNNNNNNKKKKSRIIRKGIKGVNLTMEQPPAKPPKEKNRPG